MLERGTIVASQWHCLWRCVEQSYTTSLWVQWLQLSGGTWRHSTRAESLTWFFGSNFGWIWFYSRIMIATHRTSKYTINCSNKCSSQRWKYCAKLGPRWATKSETLVVPVGWCFCHASTILQNWFLNDKNRPVRKSENEKVTCLGQNLPATGRRAGNCSNAGCITFCLVDSHVHCHIMSA